MCERLSLEHICKNCQRSFLSPSIYRRKILGTIEVISFYKYDDIKELLHTKHTDLGYYIYSILAQNSIAKFASDFDYPHMVASIGVDDYADSGYSHTAILNRALKSKCIKPIFGKLRAKNRVSYSGKNKQFRLSNPRDFELKKPDEKSVILIDDIITTNLTLTQAVQTLQKENIDILFCLTLADASVN